MGYLILKLASRLDDFPNYQAQISFDEKLSTFEWLDLTGFGPAIDEFEANISQMKISIDGFTIKASML